MEEQKEYQEDATNAKNGKSEFNLVCPRLPGESARAYDIFRRYCFFKSYVPHSGAQRSIHRLWEVLNTENDQEESSGRAVQRANEKTQRKSLGSFSARDAEMYRNAPISNS